MKTFCIAAFALASTVALCQSARAVTYGYTEDFTANDAGWRGPGTSQLLVYNATGGVDGGAYLDIAPGSDPVAGQLPGNGVILFRANASASGGAFVGNWHTSGVSRVQAYLRHDYNDLPINFFVRIPGPPGTAGVFFADQPLTASNDWTLVNFAITPDNFTIAGGPGSTFANVLSNPSNFQIGAQITAAPPNGGTVVAFDLDRVSLVPEPSSVVLVVGALICGFAARRNRSRS